MASGTHIITKEDIVIPDNISCQIIDGEYSLYIDMGNASMRHFLELCKSGLNVDDIYSSEFAPLTRLIDQLELKNYRITFDTSWGGLCFEIPVVSGKIIVKDISEDDDMADGELQKHL